MRPAVIDIVQFQPRKYIQWVIYCTLMNLPRLCHVDEKQHLAKNSFVSCAHLFIVLFGGKKALNSKKTEKERGGGTSQFGLLQCVLFNIPTASVHKYLATPAN